MEERRQFLSQLYASVFLVQCLFTKNIYDFGLMENDIKLQHLLLTDNLLMNHSTKKIDLKDDNLEKFMNACSSIQRQGSILHPIDAFCLIKKYSKYLPETLKQEHLINNLKLENQTTEVLETLSENTYRQALNALGIMLKQFLTFLLPIYAFMQSKGKIFKLKLYLK